MFDMSGPENDILYASAVVLLLLLLLVSADCWEG